MHDNSDKTLRCMKYGGSRLRTALCYLNDVIKGGGTRMTKLNITVPAEKGKLLVDSGQSTKNLQNISNLIVIISIIGHWGRRSVLY